MNQFILGEKGGKGGGGSRTPVESPNSLRSASFAKIIDVISEGEIEGLVDGHKSIYFDDTPLMNADGSYNFKDVGVEVRYGTIGQARLSNVEGVEATQTISTALKYNQPVVRSILTAGTDMVRLGIAVGQLSQTNTENGDIKGTSVQHKIEYRANGGAWITVKTDVITGKTMSGYERQITFKLNGSAPWDVRVTRLTADSASSALANASTWTTLTGVITDKFRYPATALVGIQINAEQFNNIPTRSYDVRGIKVKVPSNYNPLTRAYTGAWDGSFKVAWTDNPAWCLYDLLTNKRYGLGSRIDAGMLDKWKFYQIAQYCDQLVPNGKGGTEPRFTCNLYLQSRVEAYKFIQDMASIFRGITYWATGAIIVNQDAPASVRYQFNNTNVEGGIFDRAGSNVQTRHNVALVSWSDPSNGYKQSVEYVEDFAAIQKMGYVSETEVSAFGCTSQGMARRYGEWLLYVEQNESEIISFTTGQEGVIPLPGDVIQVSDAFHTGKRVSGRVLSGSTKTSIKLDSSVTLLSGKTYKLHVIDADGGFQTGTISTGAGTVSTLSVTGIGKVLAENTTWVLSSDDLQPELFRVVGVDELEPGKYRVSCLSYNPSKYSYVERQQTLQAPPTSNLGSMQPDVANVVVTEQTNYDKNDIPISRLLVTWKPVNAVSTAFFVEYRTAAGQWQRTTTTTQYSAEIPLLSDATSYEIRVVAGNRLLGSWANNPQTITYTPEAYSVPNITNLAMATTWTSGRNVTIKWDVTIAKAYEVQVLEGSIVKRTIKVTDSTYTYTAQDYKLDGCATRSLTFKVRAISANGRTGAWSQVVAINAQVGALQGISITSGMRKAYFECIKPVDSDLAGILIWIGTTSNFTPADANLVYDGQSQIVTLSKLGDDTELKTGVTYYLKAAAYDTFGKDSLAVSSSMSFTVAANAPDANTIQAQMIQDGALTTAKFANGIEPVSIVTGASLPTVKSTGSIMWNGRLYYWDGAKYTAQVQAADVQGQLTSAQIASLDATKVAGQLTDAQVASINAAKVTGQMVATQIADASLTTAKFASGIEPITNVSGTTVPTAKITNVITVAGKLYRWNGTAYVASVASTDISGQLAAAQIASLAASQITGQLTASQIASVASTQITGQLTDAQLAAVSAAKVTGQITRTQITDGAITTAKLSAGAVTANEIASGTITAENIASGAITTAKLSAGAVTANELAAGSVVAGKIAAGAVTATELAAGSVTTPKIMAGAVTANELAANSVVAGKLAANSVVAGNVAADAITAGSIAAGAINTRELAAGAVTASKMLIGNTTNLVLDPYGDDLSLWGKGVPDVVLDSWVGAATDPVGGGISIQTIAGRNSEFQCNAKGLYTWPMSTTGGFEVKPGEKYYVKCHVYKNAGATNIVAYLGLRVGNGVPSSSVYPRINLTLQAADSGWFVIEGIITVPDTVGGYPSKYAFVHGGLGNAATVSGELVKFGGMVIHKAMTGELIVDGSIKASHISAGSVTASALAASSVTANAIAANSITAPHIQANTITSREMTANSVTAREIAASSVTATAMSAGSVTANAVAAKAIGTQHLQADSVTAGIVAAGAINTRELAAGAITATKIAISDVTNLYPDMDMLDPSFYTSDGGVTFSGATATPLGQNYLNLSGVATARSGWFPVDPSAEFYVTALAWVSAVAAGNSAVVGVDFGTLASNGTVTQSRSITLGTNSAAWNATTSKFVTDVTTTSGERRMRFWVQNIGDASNARAGGFRVQRKANGQLIVDGAITTQKLTAGSVTGDKVAANSITTDKLVANVITSDKLAAGAVTADKLVAGSVTADKMNVAELSAVASNLGNVNITKGQGSDPYGWIRTNGKWWGDSASGTVIARNNDDGSTFFDSRAGNNRIWMSSWNDCGIEFPGIRMTNGGLTINQLDVIDTFNIKADAVSSNVWDVWRVAPSNGTRLSPLVWKTISTLYLSARSAGLLKLQVEANLDSQASSDRVMIRLDGQEVINQNGPTAGYFGDIQTGTHTIEVALYSQGNPLYYRKAILAQILYR